MIIVHEFTQIILCAYAFEDISGSSADLMQNLDSRPIDHSHV